MPLIYKYSVLAPTQRVCQCHDNLFDMYIACNYYDDYKQITGNTLYGDNMIILDVKFAMNVDQAWVIGWDCFTNRFYLVFEIEVNDSDPPLKLDITNV